ncbi:AcrR family transcriptional regulator [Arthrobacter stackebrandtii]|uniref:AcrR family transcriptional regulator n=1 Tax=Arthrobacter stackebrandtii TaxID=272161 RepID=A0ABS4YZK8_9MICC|nr:TetR family transcriptional regulator [Arthrobacter stackebrandtii]MBP2413428.1 AcrR family transcriptional regulator [Arthrobacter stackebrandtii]PYH00722.1 TetR family transcriptional regulator [Arthrobacter stackebrandtii]
MRPIPPSLTERRKTVTQLEIARAAARLFSERGAAAVTAEEIAREAGIAVRTFYRYFRTKEEAVSPLLTVGAGHWRAIIAASDPRESPLDAIERTVVEVLTPHNEADVEGLQWTLGLLRAMADDPALQLVWHRVNGNSESLLREVVARLAGPTADAFAVRLVAAAATDAMRVALETCAAADGQLTGAGAPAALAARALRELTQGISLNPQDGDVSEG